MNSELLRAFCHSLPQVTEDIKWEVDLCFSVGGKMFCTMYLGHPTTVSCKVPEDEFAQLTDTPGILPAPYVARYHWIQVQAFDRFATPEWERLIRQSYTLVVAKLPGKARRQLGL